MEPSREQLLARIAALEARLAEAASNQELQTNMARLQVQTAELEAANRKILAGHKALRQSQEDLQRAQAIAHIGSWRMDVLQNEVTMSEENYRIYGIPSGTPLSYETFLAIVHPEDRDYVDRQWTAALAGEPFDIEHRIVVGDAVKWVRSQAELEFDSQGRLLGGFGTTQDITEKKQAEERLKAAHIKATNEKKRLEAVLETLPVGVAILDELGGIVQSNDMFDTLWGSPRPRATGVGDYTAYKAWWLDTGKPVQPGEWASAQAVLQGKTIIGQTLEIERFDGVRRCVNNSAAPIRDADGKITGCAVAIIDITKHRRAEEALRESENRFKAFMDNSPAIAWAKDEAGRHVYLNKTYEDRFGVRLKDWQEKTDLELWPPELAREFRKNDLAVLASGNPLEVTEKTINPDGSLRWWWNFKFLFVDAAGNKFVGGIGVDITERRQAEEALRRSHRRLDLLAESATLLLASETPQNVVDTICPKVMEFLDCDVFFNYLRHEPENRLHLNAWAGIPEPEARQIEWLDYGEAVCGYVALDGSRMVAEDILNTAEPRTELVKSYGIQAYACQPLVSQGRVLGTLSFGTRKKKRFNDDELAMMQAVADQVAVAMERKLFLETLWNSRERERVRTMELETILEAVPIPVFISHDPSGRDITGNPAACKLLQLPRHGNFSFLAPESERPRYKAMKHGRKLKLEELPMPRALTGQRVHNFEYEVVLADGTIRHVVANAVPLLDLAGRPQGAVGAMLDLTEQKKAQEALRQANDELEERVQERTASLHATVEQLQAEMTERLRAEAELTKQTRLVHDLYNQAPCGYHSLDSEGRFVRINDTELAWLGYSREELVGKMKFADLLTPEGLETFQRNFPNFVASGRISNLEFDLRRKDGTVFPVLLNASAVTDATGNYLMSRSTVFDITERKRTERALRDSEERLRLLAVQLLTAQEQERKRLAAELHDELGHDLLTLKLSLGTIARKLSPEQADVKNLLQEQLDYIDQVMVDVRRLYQDLSPGDLEDLGLTKALENLIEDFGDLQPTIAWHVDLPEFKGLFNLPTQTIIYRLVQEALTNIGKHACPTQVRISAREKNRQVCLTIEDDGCGFDLSEIEQAHDRGMGLTAMAERLAFVDGSLQIWSQKGQGTRLIFIIPTLKKNDKST